MIRPVMVSLAVLLAACSQQYPDNEDLDTQPYFSDLRSSFQRPPASRVSFRSLDGAGGAAPSAVRPSRRSTPLIVRPLQKGAAPTPLVPVGG